MRILEVDPANWVSKDKVRVHVLNDGTFTVNGNRFRLDMIRIEDPQTNEFNGNHANLMFLDRTETRKVAFGFDETLKSGKISWTFVSGDISRENEDPYVAAIQIICNIF